MNELSPKESILIRVFLEEFKRMITEYNNIPFNPRSLTIISQPDLTKENRFDYISYNKWFDEIDVQSHIGSTRNIIQAYLEVPIRVLINSEKTGRHYLSDKDQKKLLKALKLLGEIRLEKQK